MRCPGVVVDARTRKGVKLSTVSRRDYACPMPVTVALADDNLIVREGIAQLLAGQPDIEVVASCDDLDSLLSAIDEHGPNVVVTDIRMPPTHTDEGIRLAALLRESHPNVGVVVLSNYAEAGFAMALLESGSEGRAYLLKDRVADVSDFLEAVRRVGSGGTALDPEVVSQLLARSRQRDPIDRLTEREREVLGLMAEGRSNSAIAEALVVSDGAVEKHVRNIFTKLDLVPDAGDHRRVLAVLRYLDS